MTNTAASALRMMPGPEPIERAVQAFGRRLEAKGRSPNTVSAYLRDLRMLAGLLTSRRPGLTLDRVTPAMIDSA